MAYVNLPGVFPTLLDGNLTISPPDGAPRVLVLGTAGDGLNETLYQVRRANDATLEFGRTGTLIQGMYEALSQNAKAVYLMRIGGTRASLSGIGCLLGGGGYTVTPNFKDDTAETRYSVFYDDSEDILTVFDNDTTPAVVVWSNDPADPVDLGTVSVTGSRCSAGGPDLGTVSAPLTLFAADAAEASVTLVSGTDGTAVSRIQIWEALYNAYQLLDFERFDVVIAKDVFLDDLNTADMDATERTTTRGLDALTAYGLIDVGDDSSTGNDVLGRVFVQKYQGTNYFWWDMDADGTAEIYPTVGSASDTADADGNTINAYSEVNFGYQLANFCYNATENYQASVGVIGVKPPNSLGLADVATWLGELPNYTVNPTTGLSTVASVTDNGTGLLGNKFMAGKDTFRSGDGTGGFVATDSGFVSGSEETDENNQPVDIGKYLSVVASWVVQSNAWDATGRGYIGNFAANYAGFITTLGSASAPTNKVVKRVRLPYRISASALDDAAGLRYVMLVSKPKGVVVADAPTAARSVSDYTRLTTVRIVAEVVSRIRTGADPFLGEPISTPQIAALNTALEQVLNSMKREGKLQDSRFNLVITPQDAVVGTARVDLVLVPAFELRRILVSTSLAAELV